LSAGTAGNTRGDENRAILDAFGLLVKQLGTAGHTIAASFGVAPSDLLALVKIDGALPMKDLAQRIGCDASFVTAVADALERRGLARREPAEHDRRVKMLALTPEGIAAKERLKRELAARMPWCTRLDDAERSCFLGLLRKLTAAETTRQTPEYAGRQQTPTIRSG
jgi:DNA-binding MarR family transcriptional regulator